MTRWAVGAVGVLLGLYGAWLLVSRQDLDQLENAGAWLVAGVLLHDVVLAPAVILLGVVATRVLPGWARGAAVAGLVVLGSLTLLAIPVLGRFGARPDNPTLLDRDYRAGWLLLAALTLAAVVAASLVVRTRRRRGPM